MYMPEHPGCAVKFGYLRTSEAKRSSLLASNIEKSDEMGAYNLPLFSETSKLSIVFKALVPKVSIGNEQCCQRANVP